MKSLRNTLPGRLFLFFLVTDLMSRRSINTYRYIYTAPPEQGCMYVYKSVLFAFTCSALIFFWATRPAFVCPASTAACGFQPVPIAVCCCLPLPSPLTAAQTKKSKIKLLIYCPLPGSLRVALPSHRFYGPFTRAFQKKGSRKNKKQSQKKRDFCCCGTTFRGFLRHAPSAR